MHLFCSKLKRRHSKDFCCSCSDGPCFLVTLDLTPLKRDSKVSAVFRELWLAQLMSNDSESVMVEGISRAQRPWSGFLFSFSFVVDHLFSHCLQEDLIHSNTSVFTMVPKDRKDQRILGIYHFFPPIHYKVICRPKMSSKNSETETTTWKPQRIGGDSGLIWREDGYVFFNWKRPPVLLVIVGRLLFRSLDAFYIIWEEAECIWMLKADSQ